VSLRGARFLSIWIGVRYLRTQRRQFVSLITWVSIVGLALGVAMLVVVTSVMNGFDAELKRRILGLVPHAVVMPPRRAAPLTEDALDRYRNVGQAAFRFFQGDGMIARGGSVHPVAIYGIADEGLDALGVLRASMVEGRLRALSMRAGTVVIGRPLARQLGLRVGDPVTLVLSVPSGDTVEPRLERFTLAGTFEVGAEIDYALALVGFDDILGRHLAATGITGIRFVIDDPLDVDRLERELRDRMPADWTITDWRSSYGDLFRAVRLEKGMMFVLLLLIVAIAAFNIVSAQTMLVSEKRSDIAILRTMGAPDSLVVRMVLIQGLLVAVAGVGLGVGIGLLLALNATESIALLESVIGARLLEGTYFDTIPVLILPWDIAIVVLLSLILCIASALQPARRAAALNPATALHEA
jgi:lipoprotein-releasing system permease protein